MIDLRGWFNFYRVYDWVAQHLDEVATNTPVVAEIGVWKGASTVYLHDALRSQFGNAFELFAVDTWDMRLVESINGGNDYNQQIVQMLASGLTTKDVFLNNMKQLGITRVTPVQRDSKDAIRAVGKCDFVFIDADHSTHAVLSDIEVWSPYTAILAGHDAYQDSVRLALEQRFGKNGYYASVSSGGCWTTDDELGEFMVRLDCGTHHESDCVRKVVKSGPRIQIAGRMPHCSHAEESLSV